VAIRTISLNLKVNVTKLFASLRFDVGRTASHLQWFQAGRPSKVRIAHGCVFECVEAVTRLDCQAPWKSALRVRLERLASGRNLSAGGKAA
jgi:hypothetical protein